MREDHSNPESAHLSSLPSSHSDTSDAALLEQIGHGDQQAMASLFDRYGGMVYSVALRVLQDTGNAEDVMQEVFLRLWQNPRAYVAGRGSLPAWLLVVARNRAVDMLRRRRPGDPLDEIVLPGHTDVAAEAERRTMMEKVRSVLDRLPAEQRHTLELSYFEGLSHAEIAARTGDPLGTVKTRIRSALLSVRKAFQP